MPTYQYACTECGERLEAVQSFSDPALTECPNCQGKLRKVFNSVGVVFKGSGFYRNDSRVGGGSGTPNETKSESKTTESTSSSSSADKGSSTTTSSSSSSTSTTSSTSSSTSGATKAAASS